MTTLKIDYDFKGRKKLKQLFQDNQYIFYRTELKLKDIKIYETKKGYHIYLEVKNKLTDYEIIINQLLLQSDIQREAFNYFRVKTGKFKNNWNVLFKKKMDYNNKIKSKEKYDDKLSKEVYDLLINFDFNKLSNKIKNKITEARTINPNSPTR